MGRGDVRQEEEEEEEEERGYVPLVPLLLPKVNRVGLDLLKLNAVPQPFHKHQPLKFRMLFE